MNGEAVAEIRDLARQTADPVEVGGATFSPTPLHQVQPELPEPDPLVVHTLEGLADYLSVNQDGLEEGEASIHIVSPTRVEVVSDLRGSGQRFTYARASYEPRVGPSHIQNGFVFGDFVPVERAVIAVQALFEDDGDREDVLRLLGNVRDEQVTTQEDDGITQEVIAEASIGVDREEVPNPVDLAPHRTFPEVEQPVSPFILRMQKSDRSGIQAAFFEADGGAWKLEAIERIDAWLREREVGFPILS